LAGHLLTLQQGLFELPGQKILPEQVFSGLQDTLRIIRDFANEGGEPADKSLGGMQPSEFLVLIDQFWSELLSPPSKLSAVWQLLDRQAGAAALMIDRLGPEADDDLLWW